MARRSWPLTVHCAEPGCKEYSRWEWGSRRSMLESFEFRAQEEATLAATVIQWLGTHVGFDFVRLALRDCRYRMEQIHERGPEAESKGAPGA